MHAEGYRYPLYPSFHDASALIAALAAKEATGAVLTPAASLLDYEKPAADAVTAARLVNDGMAELAATCGTGFASLGTLPLQDPDAAQDELARIHRELGLRGTMVAPIVRGGSWDVPSSRRSSRGRRSSVPSCSSTPSTPGPSRAWRTTT